MSDTIQAAQAYATGPITAYDVHRSQRVMGELIAEVERLSSEVERLRRLNERAISRLGAACEVLCQVARREGITKCPKCQGALDAISAES